MHVTFIFVCRRRAFGIGLRICMNTCISILPPWQHSTSPRAIYITVSMPPRWLHSTSLTACYFPDCMLPLLYVIDRILPPDIILPPWHNSTSLTAYYLPDSICPPWQHSNSLTAFSLPDKIWCHSIINTSLTQASFIFE